MDVVRLSKRLSSVLRHALGPPRYLTVVRS
jgi:hypothetical protein